MPARVHGEVAPGCPTCNPDSAAAVEVCGCLEDGFSEALRRWQVSCPCCFGDAHPEGLEAAVAAARG